MDWRMDTLSGNVSDGQPQSDHSHAPAAQPSSLTRVRQPRRRAAKSHQVPQNMHKSVVGPTVAPLTHVPDSPHSIWKNGGYKYDRNNVFSYKRAPKPHFNMSLLFAAIITPNGHMTFIRWMPSPQDVLGTFSPEPDSD